VRRSRVAWRPVLASVPTFAIEGIDSREVTVEVDVRQGLPLFTLVGLPDRAIRESRERVRAALLNSGLAFPMKRLTVNLAPAHLHKVGPAFDLAIAVGLMAASEQVPRESVESYAVCGELSLTGALRPVRGSLAVALGAAAKGYPRLVVPVENAAEAALVDGLEVYGVASLGELAELMHGRLSPRPARPVGRVAGGTTAGPDLADVRGQGDAKRALEIAAAGGHNVLMVGPPGAGKTMLARRLPGVLPPPGFEEALEITRVRSVAGLGGGGLATERPFRAPHHTISASGLVGGGAVPRPGEVTLAHRGVLFLDEVAEFGRGALDALRQPLEDGRVEIMRGQRTLGFPACVTLVAACNPCPCARPADRCTCGEIELARYARRLSGPLLDRIDMVCQVDPVSPRVLTGTPDQKAEASAVVRQRVVSARERQRGRLAGSGALCNADMDAPLTRRHVRLPRKAARALSTVPDLALLSGRGHDRVLRVARTIADLDGRERLDEADVHEAVGYRTQASWSAAVAA
jgi:magnesium chelatase family protein